MAQPADAVLYSQPGAELRTRSFTAHKPLVDRVVADAKPLLLKRPKIVVMGGEVEQPRDVGFFSNESTGYLYSYRIMEAQPLTDAMRELLGVLNAAYGLQFNGLLINRYRSGKDSVGAHGDKEDGLDTAAGVVILSWGAVRTFRLRHARSGTGIVKDVPTTRYHALQMHGPRFQKDLTHEIPKQLRIDGERVSITARRHLPFYEGMLSRQRQRDRDRARREAEE